MFCATFDLSILFTLLVICLVKCFMTYTIYILPHSIYVMIYVESHFLALVFFHALLYILPLDCICLHVTLYYSYDLLQLVSVRGSDGE
jgi:hypothetical protein